MPRSVDASVIERLKKQIMFGVSQIWMRMTKLESIQSFQAVLMKYSCMAWEMHNLLETWGYIGLLMVLVFSPPKSLGLFDKLFAASENKGGIKTLGLPEILSPSSAVLMT